MRTTTWFLSIEQSTHRALHGTWSAVTACLPELHALVVLPDRVQLIHPSPLTPGWDPGWPAPPLGHARHGLATEDDLVHAVHAVHTSPCRGGWVDDPLAWPWSTCRDHLGLALPTVVTPRRPWRPRVEAVPPRPLGVDEVLDGVSALTRTWRGEVGRWPYPRSLALTALIARGVPAAQAHDAVAPTGPSAWVRPADLTVLWWVAGDARFQGLAPEQAVVR